MKNVLVTGWRGFLGRHLVRELQHREDINRLVLVSRPNQKSGSFGIDHATMDQLKKLKLKITIIEKNLNSLRYDLDPYRIDTVFHLAGASSGSNPDDEVWRSNVDGTRNLLSILPQGIRVIFASSSTVYGNGITPQASSELSEIKPTSLYGLSKATAENLVNFYTERGLIQGVSLRFCAIVGSEATHGLLPDLIRKLQSTESTLNLWGNPPGSNKPFVHVHDAVQALIHFGGGAALAEGNIYKGRYHGAYNISPADGLDVEKVANMVMTKMQVFKRKVWGGEATSPRGDNQFVRLNREKAAWVGFGYRYGSSEKAVQQALEDIL